MRNNSRCLLCAAAFCCTPLLAGCSDLETERQKEIDQVNREIEACDQEQVAAAKKTKLLLAEFKESRTLARPSALELFKVNVDLIKLSSRQEELARKRARLESIVPFSKFLADGLFHTTSGATILLGCGFVFLVFSLVRPLRDRDWSEIVVRLLLALGRTARSALAMAVLLVVLMCYFLLFHREGLDYPPPWGMLVVVGWVGGYWWDRQASGDRTLT